MAQNYGMRFRLTSTALGFGLMVVLAPIAVGARNQNPVEPVDLNRASVAELMRVPGMTASWAGRIVRFRPYRSKLDLVEFGVVSPEVYKRIRDGIVAHRIDRQK